MSSMQQPRVRLAVNVLEAREVPAATVDHGVLTVRGTGIADHLTINRVIIPGTVFVQVNENGQTSEFPAFQVRRVRVFGNGGDDYISSNIAGLNAVVYGGYGRDTI